MQGSGRYDPAFEMFSYIQRAKWLPFSSLIYPLPSPTQVTTCANYSIFSLRSRADDDINHQHLLFYIIQQQ